MTLSKLCEMVKERKPGVFQSMGLQRVGLNLATEWDQQQSRDLFTTALHSATITNSGNWKETYRSTIQLHFTVEETVQKG